VWDSPVVGAYGHVGSGGPIGPIHPIGPIGRVASSTPSTPSITLGGSTVGNALGPRGRSSGTFVPVADDEGEDVRAQERAEDRHRRNCEVGIEQDYQVAQGVDQREQDGRPEPDRAGGADEQASAAGQQAAGGSPGTSGGGHTRVDGRGGL